MSAPEPTVTGTQCTARGRARAPPAGPVHATPGLLHPRAVLTRFRTQGPETGGLSSVHTRVQFLTRCGWHTCVLGQGWGEGVGDWDSYSPRLANREEAPRHHLAPIHTVGGPTAGSSPPSRFWNGAPASEGFPWAPWPRAGQQYPERSPSAACLHPQGQGQARAPRAGLGLSCHRTLRWYLRGRPLLRPSGS